MKRIILLVVLLCFLNKGKAQVNAIPFVGINSTKMNNGTDFKSGGAFGLVGVDVEFKKPQKKHHAINFTIATGISYLKNGYYRTDNFAIASLSYYYQNIINMSMQYWQVPIMLRIHWQPFPLIEDWKIFLGGGICNNFLIKSTLHEKYTVVIYNTNPLSPPTTTQYEDKGDITDSGKSSSLFRRIEVGMNYKKILVSFRLSKSITDLYHNGIEKTWGVPSDKSKYISSHNTDGKTTEKYTELVIGYRIGK